MKNILLLVFLCVNVQLLHAQQSITNSWLKNIDTISYKVYYKKKFVSRKIIATIDMKKSWIAEPNGRFRAGCTGKGKSKRLNWVAKDKNGHIILSISHGGLASGISYYFIDSDSGSLNANKLEISGRNNSFVDVVDKIQSLDYSVIRYDDWKWKDEK